MNKSRFFQEIEMDRVERLRDANAHFGRAFFASIDTFEKWDEKERNSIIAATYFRRAAANSMLLDDFATAREFFEQAAGCYTFARMPYGIMMEALSGHQTADAFWSWKAVSESPEEVYFLIAGLSEDMPSPYLEEFRRKLDEFRGKRLGVFAVPLDQYLDLFDAVYASISNTNIGLQPIREALLPFAQAYSYALKRAKRDTFHWQRLAMVFHPVEPDILGLLAMTENAIEGSNLSQYDLLDGLPVSPEATDLLRYCLSHLKPHVKDEPPPEILLYK